MGWRLITQAQEDQESHFSEKMLKRYLSIVVILIISEEDLLKKDNSKQKKEKNSCLAYL